MICLRQMKTRQENNRSAKIFYLPFSRQLKMPPLTHTSTSVTTRPRYRVGRNVYVGMRIAVTRPISDHHESTLCHELAVIQSLFVFCSSSSFNWMIELCTKKTDILSLVQVGTPITASGPLFHRCFRLKISTLPKCFVPEPSNVK